MDSSEILTLIQEALNLAEIAVQHDKLGNSLGAYDYYDKTLLTLDEVISKLPKSSPQYKKLFQLRLSYDERMEFLKESEQKPGRPSSASMDGTEGGQGVIKATRSQDETNFKEILINQQKFVQPPSSSVLFPFYILRNMQKSVEEGGFLTESLFLPKKMWHQSDVKFSGINIKTTFFTVIIKLIATHIDTLYFSYDEDSLVVAEGAVGQVLDEMLTLQNQLSKYFNFIKETQKPQEAQEEAATGGASATGRESVSEAGGEKKRSLAGIVVALGKNVRKYAEVGLSRLSVALPTKLSVEEFGEYRGLILRICSKCQVVGDWLLYTTHLLEGQHVNPMGDVKDGVAVSLSEVQRGKAESLLGMLRQLSQSVREIVCEILIRDVEYLLDKYLLRTRKSFSRMYWDDETNGSVEILS